MSGVSGAVASDLAEDVSVGEQSATVRRVARAGGRGQKAKPSEEFTHAFLLAFGLLSALIAAALVSMYRLPEEATEPLTLTAEEAHAIGSPILRILMRAKRIQRLSRFASGKGDYLELGEALISYGSRVATVIATYKQTGEITNEPTRQSSPRGPRRWRLPRRERRPAKEPAANVAYNGHRAGDSASASASIPVHGDAFGAFD